MLTKCLFSIQTWVCIYWWTRKKPFDRWYDQKMQVQYVMLKQGILLSWVRIMLLRIKWIFCEFQPKAQILSFPQDYRLYDDKCCCWPFVIPAINWGSNQVILCRNGWNNLRFYTTAATNSLFSYTWNEGQFWEIWKKISLNCNSLFKKWQKVSLAKPTIFLVWSKQGMEDRVQPSPSLKFCKDFS